MKIYLGADHAGFTLKEFIKKFLLEKYNCEVIDKGAVIFDEMDDYPDLVRPVAVAVAEDRQNGKESYGIIFGGSGQGEAIIANRISGVRCAVYYGGSKEVITLSREHNDANVLSLGARFLSDDEALEAVKLWIETHFSEDERHVRRNKKIDA